jgi:ribonuclease HI
MTNIRIAHEAIKQITGNAETEATIWRNLRNEAIRPIIQQFLFKTTHNTYMIGKYWRRIQGCEDRGTCTICDTTESMSHILTECNCPPTRLIWRHAQNLWPFDDIGWPEINMGTIIGCGSIHLQTNNAPINDNQPNTGRTKQGPTRLLQILISEAAHLIWAMRCERVIQGKLHNANEIKERWLRTINERLTIDKIQATTIKRDEGFTKLVVKTWEQALKKECELPIDWINNSEVLVGRTAQRA